MAMTPPGSPPRTRSGGSIPLASSFPVVENLTPRARRRETLKARADEKRRRNLLRAQLAANNRENRARAANVSAAKAAPAKRADAAASVPAATARSRVGTKRTAAARPERDVPPKRAALVRAPSASSGGRSAAPAARRRTASPAATPGADSTASAGGSAELEAARAEAAAAREQLDAANAAADGLRGELDQAKSDADGLRSELEQAAARTKALEVAHEAEKTAAAVLRKQLQDETAAKKAVQEELRHAKGAIARLEEQVEAHQRLERELRNTILELKGNIRVFARVRPTQPQEAEAARAFSFPEDDPEQQHITVLTEGKEGVDGRQTPPKPFDFKFDKVFHEHHDQAAVFDEVSQLIQSVLDGYRVCIFAYGQTGSGKTYTMDGDGTKGEGRGIIPRAVQHIFGALEAQKEWGFELSASFLEIYNETVRDLSQGSSADAAAPLEIRLDGKSGDTVVPGLTETPVRTAEDLEQLMQQASKARAVAATKSNERSSRSHSVFTLTVTGTHKASGERRRGLLNLVDLAGSERLRASQAQGQQLRETQAINKSLSSLGDVIFALASGAKHVPFRNSKLTHLLQGSLGGNCKTLMIVNLAPNSPAESLCSLRFGHKVNACDIGTARQRRA